MLRPLPGRLIGSWAKVGSTLKVALLLEIKCLPGSGPMLEIIFLLIRLLSYIIKRAFAFIAFKR